MFAAASLARSVSKPVSRMFTRPLELSAGESADPLAAGRAQLISSILEKNPSASLEFLGRFPEPALKDYLDHLEMVDEPRGMGRGWVRRSGAPAIVTRVALT